MIDTAYFHNMKNKCPICGAFGKNNKDYMECPVCKTKFNEFFVLELGKDVSLNNN